MMETERLDKLKLTSAWAITECSTIKKLKSSLRWLYLPPASSAWTITTSTGASWQDDPHRIDVLNRDFDFMWDDNMTEEVRKRNYWLDFINQVELWKGFETLDSKKDSCFFCKSVINEMWKKENEHYTGIDLLFDDLL